VYYVLLLERECTYSLKMAKEMGLEWEKALASVLGWE
jgi:hypothetical protein